MTLTETFETTLTRVPVDPIASVTSVKLLVKLGDRTGRTTGDCKGSANSNILLFYTVKGTVKTKGKGRVNSFDLEVYLGKSGKDEELLFTRRGLLLTRRDEAAANLTFFTKRDLIIGCAHDDGMCLIADPETGEDRQISDKSMSNVFVKIVAAGNKKTASNAQMITCDKGYSCKVSKEGAHFSDTVPVSIQAGHNAVQKTTHVLISAAPVDMDPQFFPDDIDTDVRTVTIGDASLRFCHPVHVQWRLDRSATDQLDLFDGTVVQLDPDSLTWSKVDHVARHGNRVVFPISRGGVFGIASHPRYRRGVLEDLS